jgi:hypothetical protein
MNFRQAAARFSAEVERALTRARRATREARAESADFRRRTEEIASQAKAGKLRGLRRAEAAATDPAARADAAKFRNDNGLPVAELPTADELTAGLPGRQPRPPKPENDDFVEPRVLFDIDSEPRESQQAPPEQDEQAEQTEAPKRTRTGDAEDDFSQQRILMDATAETYRPDEVMGSVFDLDDRDNRR